MLLLSLYLALSIHPQVGRTCYGGPDVRNHCSDVVRVSSRIKEDNLLATTPDTYPLNPLTCNKGYTLQRYHQNVATMQNNDIAANRTSGWYAASGTSDGDYRCILTKLLAPAASTPAPAASNGGKSYEEMLGWKWDAATGSWHDNAINFPQHPAMGQRYRVNAHTYEYQGTQYKYQGRVYEASGIWMLLYSK